MPPKRNWDALGRRCGANRDLPELWRARLQEDMQAQWLQGRPILVEEYLINLPELLDDDQAFDRLLETEGALRGEYGAQAGAAEYQARLRRWFPNPARRVVPASVSEQPASSSLPAQIGPYRPVQILGVGGQATVYLVECERAERHAALRVFNRGRIPPSIERIFFEREAHWGSQLDHPGFCRVHRAGQNDGTRWLEMEYIPGPGLDVYARPERLLPPLAAVRLVRELAGTLMMLHALNVRHRDIKLGNVRFRRDGTPVLIDLGMVTGDGQAELVGSLENLDLGKVDPNNPVYPEASDVGQLGLILYQLLYGRLPWPNQRDLGRLEILQLSGNIPFPDDVAVDARLIEICRRALSPIDGSTRCYDDMLEFHDALADHEQAVAASWRDAQIRQRRRRSRRGWLAAAAVAITALVGTTTLGYWLHPPGQAGRIGPLALAEAARKYLAPLPPRQRETIRFLSLANLRNNRQVSDAAYREHRAALDDLIRTLSNRSPEQVLHGVDEQGALLAFNMLALGWDANLWQEVLSHYPYGVVPKVGRRVTEEVNSQTSSKLPILRADWLLGFLVTHPEGGRFLQRANGRIPDRVMQVGQRFLQGPVTLHLAAEELDLCCPDALVEAIGTATPEMPALLALAPLVKGEPISRSLWETPINGVSPFHAAVIRVGVGQVVSGEN
jgi:serine/threonine protein kinase